MIEVGDTIANCDKDSIVVDEVLTGKHGLLIRGKFTDSNNLYEGYHPSELPPCQTLNFWYGWRSRDFTTLSNGVRIGSVDISWLDPRCTIEEYDKEWERTLETIRLEQIAGDTPPMQSRPFTEQSRPDVIG